MDVGQPVTDVTGDPDEFPQPGIRIHGRQHTEVAAQVPPGLGGADPFQDQEPAAVPGTRVLAPGDVRVLAQLRPVPGLLVEDLLVLAARHVLPARPRDLDGNVVQGTHIDAQIHIVDPAGRRPVHDVVPVVDQVAG